MPPRMHKKGDVYYHVSTTLPRKWTRLSDDFGAAKLLWARLESGPAHDGTFAAAADRYQAECMDDLALGSQKNYAGQIVVLKKCFGHMPLSEIKPMHVAGYMDGHPSKAQGNLGRSIMSSIFERAMRWGWCDTNPTRGLRANKTPRRDRYLSDAEYTAIMAEASDVVKVAMEISYLTGLRESDVLKLSLADIRPDGLYIIQKKTGKKQAYEITPPLAEAIQKARDLPRPVRGLYLLCTRRGQPYSRQSFYEQWQRACVAAEVEDAHFHDIRAKSATDAKKQGLDYQAMLGHSSRAMSDRYIKAREYDRVIPLARKV